MGRRGREEKEEEEGAKEILALLCRVLQSISRAGGFARKGWDIMDRFSQWNGMMGFTL